jgi:hypothetical protein
VAVWIERCGSDEEDALRFYELPDFPLNGWTEVTHLAGSFL